MIKSFLVSSEAILLFGPGVIFEQTERQRLLNGLGAERLIRGGKGSPVGLWSFTSVRPRMDERNGANDSRIGIWPTLIQREPPIKQWQTLQLLGSGPFEP